MLFFQKKKKKVRVFFLCEKMSVVIDRLQDAHSLCTIEGNIGAGKSFVIAGIKRYIEKNGVSAIDASPVTEGEGIRHLFRVMDEPVDAWCEAKYSLLNSRGEGEDATMYQYLDLFYKGQNMGHPNRRLAILLALNYICLYITVCLLEFFEVISAFTTVGMCVALILSFCHALYYSQGGVRDQTNPWAFDFQVFAFTTRIRHMCEQLAKLPKFDERTLVHVISERSLRTDRLFFKNLYESGKVPQHQWLNYESFHDIICRDTLKKTGSMIYVNTSPEKAHTRILKRARAAETNNALPLAYLRPLHDAHQEMVASFVAEKGEEALYTMNFEQDMTEAEVDVQVAALMHSLKCQ